jgi:transcriptional regulator with XRE-family HTH domain
MRTRDGDMAASARRIGEPSPAHYEELQANVATNLRAARKAVGLTQRALGDLAAVARDYVRRIEGQETNISLHTLCALAVHVNRHPLDLLGPPAAPTRSRRRS